MPPRVAAPDAARLLGAADLVPSTDLATARSLLRGYRPEDAEQARVRDRILAFVDEHPDAALRNCVPGHLTASALVLAADGTRALFTHHRKLRRWLQLGGHCDGETNFARAALSEAVEESGIADLRVDPTIVDVDVHAIPARGAEPEHLHLDVRYAIWAPAGAREVASSESLELAWIPFDELADLDTDDSVRRIARRLLER